MAALGIEEIDAAAIEVGNPQCRRQGQAQGFLDRRGMAEIEAKFLQLLKYPLTAFGNGDIAKKGDKFDLSALGRSQLNTDFDLENAAVFSALPGFEAINAFFFQVL